MQLDFYLNSETKFDLEWIADFKIKGTFKIFWNEIWRYLSYPGVRGAFLSKTKDKPANLKKVSCNCTEIKPSVYKKYLDKNAKKNLIGKFYTYQEELHGLISRRY